MAFGVRRRTLYCTRCLALPGWRPPRDRANGPAAGAHLERSIRVLADALLERRTMTGDEVGALLSAVTAPRALWVVA